MWILYAIRPLTPMELIAAISMIPLALGFDTNGLTVKTILDVCQNLVVFDEKLVKTFYGSPTIQFRSSCYLILSQRNVTLGWRKFASPYSHTTT